MLTSIEGTFAPYAHVELEEGESVVAESGALFFHDDSVKAETFVPGGISKGLIRKLSGTRFFLVRYTGPGVLALSKNHSGQLQKIPLGGTRASSDVVLQSDAFVFCEPGVEINSASDLSSNFFQTHRALGTFLALRFQGQGALFAMGFGDVREVALGIGERLITAPGKVMAFDRCVGVERVRKRELTSILSGESERIEMRGPGRVWLQTRDRRREKTVVVTHEKKRSPQKPRPIDDDDIQEKWIWDPR